MNFINSATAKKYFMLRMLSRARWSSSLCVDQVGSWQKLCKPPLTGPQVARAKSFEGNATLGKRNWRLPLSTSRTIQYSMIQLNTAWLITLNLLHHILSTSCFGTLFAVNTWRIKNKLAFLLVPALLSWHCWRAVVVGHILLARAVLNKGQKHV